MDTSTIHRHCKYAAVAEHLRKIVREGQVRPGQKLGSEHALVRETGFSRNSVRKAVGQLEMPIQVAQGACPDCGGAIEHEGGCMVCRACGYSKCS